MAPFLFLLPEAVSAQAFAPGAAFPSDAPVSYAYGSLAGDWDQPLDVLLGSPIAGGAAGLHPTLLHLRGLEAPAARAALRPVWKCLESAGYGPAAFLRQSPARRVLLLQAAIKVVEQRVRQDASSLVAAAARVEPGRSELVLMSGGLEMLTTSLSPYLDEEGLAAARRARAEIASKLTDIQKQRLRDRISQVRAAWERSGGKELTAVELAAALTPRLPRRMLTPPIAELRRVAGLPTLPAPPAGRLASLERPSLRLRSRLAAVQAAYAAKGALARPYRIFLETFRSGVGWAGELYRKYFSGQEMDSHSFRWHVIEELHRAGDFRGSFGHPVHEGAVEIQSPLIFPAPLLDRIRGQAFSLRPDVSAPGKETESLRLGPMLGISGMSFPQLSAPSHLSLLYIHLKLAQDGVRQLYNTGEGGPGFHLAMLEGDREKVKEEVVRWNVENGQFAQGSWEEAGLVGFVDRLMDSRDRLLAEFSPGDLRRAQIVAQFGSALNGIRNPEGKVDFEKLRRVGASPYVKMIQYKLKQAAKRGAKVDSRKIDALVAALRDIPRDKPFKSPEVNPEMDSYADIARLLLATKLVTGKPVSLKFGVGDPGDLYGFLKFLRDSDALPEHIQLDGRGEGFSPGSGNAPPGANTSLPLNEAVIAADAILKKLGIRERIFLDATGDILLPAEAVEKLALGADGVSGARVWMGMGLGCAMVRSCADGNCPYGISARSNALVGLAMDPARVGPQGARAAANWQKSYVQTLAETGAASWIGLREAFGLGAGAAALRKKVGLRMVTLDEVYNEDYVLNLLRGVLDRGEVRRYVFGRPS